VDVRDLGYAPRDRMLAVRQWGRIYPPDEYARIVSAELVDAPPHIAEALAVNPGASVIRRHRVTYRGEVPVSASTSWFEGSLAEVAPDLVRTERIRQGTPAYVQQQTGRTVKFGRDQVRAALASPDAAIDLSVPEGSPVLVGRNWVRDADGNPIEFGEYVSVPDRWQTYEYELD
jgi:DNA-binding GntR family transcriptional regulator